ncbi:hypothetical protein ACFL2U_03035 [Patescibacteria group bacterium]
MQDKFHVNACIKLKSTKEKPINICEVPEVVSGDFGKNLNSLYGEALIKCIRELNTSRLSVVSIKIMPVGEVMKITINVILSQAQKAEGDDEPSTHRKVNFTHESDNVKRLNLHRLTRFMEAKALSVHRDQFDSVVHFRIIRFEKDDVSPEKF